MQKVETKRENPLRKPSEEWLEDFKDRIQPFLLKGDYQGGLKVVKLARKIYPHSIEVAFQYAKLLGDAADEFPPARQEIAKKEAVEILRPIVRALSGRPAAFRFSVCLNYYYQKKDYRGMFRFGHKLSLRKDRLGIYAKGVASALLAETYIDSGKIKAAKSWAEKSRGAWMKYDLSKEKYYFPFYCLALAECCAGLNSQSLKTLKRAAKVSDRPITDSEFKSLLKRIEKS